MGTMQPTFKQKFRRWINLHYKGKVLLKRLSRDPETGGYRLDIEECNRSDLPTEALHQPGNPYVFTIDTIKKRWPYRTDERGFSAIDLCLWMESNDINDALAYKWNNLNFFNEKGKWILIIAVAGIAVLIFYLVKGNIMG